MDELSAQERVLFRRQNLGFIFQQYNLLPALTAAENVAVPLLAAGVARKQARADRAKELLVATRPRPSHSTPFPSSSPAASSSASPSPGRSIHEPRLVVCDEPTAALDSRERRGGDGAAGARAPSTRTGRSSS